MSESEMVKMCVVLIPMLAMFVPAIIGGIIEMIKDRKSVDLSKTKEGKELLAYMIGEGK